MDVKTIHHIASLARIKLTAKEEEKMQGELSSILGYIEQLSKVNTEGVEPLYQTTGLVNSMRKDEPGGIANDNNFLVGQAPDKENGFVKVRSVLNK